MHEYANEDIERAEMDRHPNKYRHSVVYRALHLPPEEFQDQPLPWRSRVSACQALHEVCQVDVLVSTSIMFVLPLCLPLPFHDWELQWEEELALQVESSCRAAFAAGAPASGLRDKSLPSCPAGLVAGIDDDDEAGICFGVIVVDGMLGDLIDVVMTRGMAFAGGLACCACAKAT